ncbi:ferric reductase-like transmembrane domain-containing protein [Paenibacillus sp. BAC0078]
MQAWLSNLSDSLSVWTTVRAAGFTSYLLLFVAIIAGLLQGEAWAKGTRRAQLLLIHQWSGWFGLLFGIVHGLVLTFDKYVGYSFFDIVIPFAAKNEPLWTGLGSLSFYMLLAIMASSDLMRKISKKLWRAIHFLALPTYVMALLHGIMLGTDSSTAWIQVLYMLTALAVACMVIRRISSGRGVKEKKRQVSVSIVQHK